MSIILDREGRASGLDSTKIGSSDALWAKVAVAELDCSPQLRTVFTAMAGSPALSIYTEALMRSGAAGSLEDALRIGVAAVESEFISPPGIRIAKNHFSGKLKNPWLELSKELGIDQKAVGMIYGQYGRQGHEALERYIVGAAPSHSAFFPEDPKPVFSQQVLLTELSAEPSQAGEGEERDVAKDVILPQYAYEVLAGNSFSTRHLDRIEACLRRLQHRYRGSEDIGSSAEAVLLEQLLEPAYGDQIQYLHRYVEEENADLRAITLMSCAAAMIKMRKNEGSSDNTTLSRYPGFRELFILDSDGRYNNSEDIRLGAGKLDILRPVSIGGRSLTSAEKRMVGQMSRREWTSVGHVIGALERFFGAPVYCVIDDLKFMVGDGERLHEFIDPEKIPYRKHVDQMHWYMTFADVDDARVNWREGGLSSIWKKETHGLLELD